MMLKNKITNLILNFGPQHPAAHGVLRLIFRAMVNLCKINELCTFYIGATHIGLPYFLLLYIFDINPLERTGIHVFFSVVIILVACIMIIIVLDIYYIFL